MTRLLTRCRQTFRHGVRDSPLLPVRLALCCIVAVLALSFLQLVLTLVLHSAYVDWFLADHGYSRDTAPRGEVAGIYLALGLRTLFSVLWIMSFTRFLELVAEHTTMTLWTIRAHAVICLAGYGYLLCTGGPWWIASIRGAQCLLGLTVLGCTFIPRAAAWWTQRAAQSNRAEWAQPSSVSCRKPFV